ncbi:MAG: tetratricopeptide repeat protein [Opitutales bacterium]
MLKYLTISLFLFGSLPAQPSLEDVKPDGSMADRRLLSIVKRQQSLMERVARTADENNTVSPDVERQITQLSNEWLSYVADNPEDVDARILYGKFLRSFGQNESAVEQFLMADRLDNSLPVVKQQIGNYMAENGLYTESLTWFLQAVTLAPKEPRYHFQMGELLYQYRWQFIEDGSFTRESLDRDMLTAFGQAAFLLPEDFPIQLRYAESYYDIEKPQWHVALSAFEQALPLARNEVETQAVLLHLARVNMHLDNIEPAKELLSRVNLPVYAATKAQIEAALVEH